MSAARLGDMFENTAIPYASAYDDEAWVEADDRMAARADGRIH